MPDPFATPEFSGAASGATAGALAGSMVLPGLGTGIGALGGGVLGLLSGHSQRKAQETQQKALDEAMKRLQAFSMQQYSNRMADLDKTLQFYKPADNYLGSLYGKPGSTPQPGYTPKPSGPLGMP